MGDLFNRAGMKDSFPESVSADRGGCDSLNCPTKRMINGIKKPDLEDYAENVCRVLIELRVMNVLRQRRI